MNGSQSGDEAGLTYSSPELTQGLWGLVTDEIGPYGPNGSTFANGQANTSVVTAPFDTTVTSSTSDLWPDFTLDTTAPGTFNPLYLASEACGTIKPTATVGITVTGVMYIDDFVLGSNINPSTTFVPGNAFGFGIFPSGDQVIGIPYQYKVTA